MADKRTVKTLAAIRKAFSELIIEQDDVMFTIKEIAAKADINRKTFYLHFNSIEGLYEDLEKRTEEKLIAILEEKNFFSERFSLRLFLDSLLELIETNEPLYERLLIEDKYKFLFRNVKNKIKEKIVPFFITHSNSLKAEMETEYVFSGLIKLFRVWHKRKDEMGKEEMYETAYKIVKFGLNGLSQGIPLKITL